MNLENPKTYSKEYVEKIEYLYQERLKDKDELINHLHKIIIQIGNIKFLLCLKMVCLWGTI